jgi:hypothetical protein
MNSPTEVPATVDNACVARRGLCDAGRGRRELVTISHALACLSGHWCGDEPANKRFLRTGEAVSPHASYSVLGTPEEVAVRLAAYRESRLPLRKFVASEAQADFLAGQHSQQTG